MDCRMSALLEVTPTEIPDVLLLTTRRFGDDRGFLTEVFNRERWRAAGLPCDFSQDNQALSTMRGTLRGLHFQRPPQAQTKLVRASRGAIWDVAVDLRAGSPWYGRWVGHELSTANGVQMLIPAGFAHGYVTLEADSEATYKVDAPYAPETEAGLRWDDPTLAIAWPIAAADLVILPRDLTLPVLAELAPAFTWSQG